MQMRRNGNANRLRLESYIKMVIARQAAGSDLPQYTADNRAQCLLHNIVVGNQAFGNIIAHICFGGLARRGNQGTNWHFQILAKAAILLNSGAHAHRDYQP